ncbi:MAG: nickel pincer cofactor biosynthesis protein LarC [Candidatus Omnitrophica bacterium]|nr:nickel pincer cofactor biosynthesis protein LarC [Candidatus Omnitrophota bacterium]
MSEQNRYAYLDCAAGISGDMFLAACIDCGVSRHALQAELLKLGVGKILLRAKLTQRGHIRGMQVAVAGGSRRHFHCPEELYRVLDASRLAATVKEKSIRIIRLLAGAEARAHRKPLSAVHFHQLGEMDTLADVVGSVAAVEMLGLYKIYAAPVTVGTGSVVCGEETFPLPAPAAVELLKKRTVRFAPDIWHETVTPTGAALLAGLTEEISGVCALCVEKIGYGAGSLEQPGSPNVLRLMIGKMPRAAAGERIVVLETNIDDMSPLYTEILFERLYAAGALDVCLVPALMKKMRQGVVLQVQAARHTAAALQEIIFQETPTLGIRAQEVSRTVLERKILKLKSDYGIIVDVKIGTYDGTVMTVSPEYEQCRQIARKTGRPFKFVYERIRAQALRQVSAARAGTPKVTET